MIRGILISTLAPMENHIANGGEKLLGNASSIKRRPDGKVYISGQMQRHSLFSAIERLNNDDKEKGSTYVSNADGVSMQIEKDLRADMGGFLDPTIGDYSGRRIAPLSVTPAVALNESQIGRDMLLQLQNLNREHNLATKEFSQLDVMHMNFFLDLSSLGISKAFEYGVGESEKSKNRHVNTIYFKHVNNTERLRRTRLFIESTRSLTDYANQARNAVSGEPQKVLIVFDTKLSRKASRYFTSSDVEQKNILGELEDRGAKYYIGDDTTEQSVNKAYKEAFEFLQSAELYDPSGKPDDQLSTFEEFRNSMGK